MKHTIDFAPEITTRIPGFGPEPPVRRLPDGSIDLHFYINRSHVLRSNATTATLKAAFSSVLKLFGKLRG